MYVTFNIQFGNFFISESLSASLVKSQMGTRCDYAKRLFLRCYYNRKSKTLCMLSDLIVIDMCSLKTLSKKRLLNEGDISQFRESLQKSECFLCGSTIHKYSKRVHNDDYSSAAFAKNVTNRMGKKNLIGGRQ